MINKNKDHGLELRIQTADHFKGGWCLSVCPKDAHLGFKTFWQGEMENRRKMNVAELACYGLTVSNKTDVGALLHGGPVEGRHPSNPD